MKISIIVVALNPGDELGATVKSILSQTFSDYEIIIKDGGSTDNSMESVPADERIKVINASDTGIYDAMNQALEAAQGEYVYFLNCGDYFGDEAVLKSVVGEIELQHEALRAAGDERTPLVIYGDIFDRLGNSRVTSNPRIDEAACYRNVPCHQACFYDRSMLLMHPFQTEYRIRADYEQFLWCIYIARAKAVYLDMVISSYMGGGFSETKENRRRSAKEHSEIVENYMPHSHVVKYKLQMILSLAPLRAFIARNRLTSGLYNKIKAGVYNKRKEK